MKLNALKFGLAAGIFWGLAMFVMTLAGIWFDYGHMWLQLMADVYPGYEVTYWGSVVGLVYGFFDGFIGLSIFAFIYNKLVD